ncbi:MAG: DUF1573 domain-containing protein [Saprospiraceae bacterium]
MFRYFVFFSIAILFSCNSKSNVNQNSAQADKPAESEDNSISDMISNPASYKDEKTDPKKAAVISFDNTIFKFSRVKAGTIVEHEFKFTNTGKNPLIIKDAIASCGCTVAEYPKEPIAPGASGTILAKFNTEGKNSMQVKYISVYANTIPNETRLAMEGEVYKE